MVFPGEQTETWTYDDRPSAWYYHRFYDFQPDLNWSNPAVRARGQEDHGVLAAAGVAGFRIDAAPFILEQPQPATARPKDFAILDEWRAAPAVAARRRGAAVRGERRRRRRSSHYTGDAATARTTAPHMMFAFVLNPRLWLALARAGRRAADRGAEARARRCRPMAQWATFLRNHDELDLSRLTAEQRDEVFAEFAPGREHADLRPRHPPPAGADAAAATGAGSSSPTRCSSRMPGTPVLRYGEEIGMGEDLVLRRPGRDPDADAVGRRPNAGFSTGRPGVWSAR